MAVASSQSLLGQQQFRGSDACDKPPAGRTAKMKATVLIVDDDRRVCQPLTNALRREGYEALLAHNGVEAFVLYGQRRPDVVLLALNMKGQSGWDILEKISPLDPLTRPLMVISGFADQLGSTVAACVGALLTKPSQSLLPALTPPAVRRVVGGPALKRRSWRRYGVLTRWLAVNPPELAGEGGRQTRRALAPHQAESGQEAGRGCSPIEAITATKAAPEVKGKADGLQAPDPGGREDQILFSALRRFVGDSKLSGPRIARLMGVGESTLSAWLAGKRKARRAKLLELESFLSRHAPKHLNDSKEHASKYHLRFKQAPFEPLRRRADGDIEPA
jgi:CheY-like chemotaxis protein